MERVELELLEKALVAFGVDTLLFLAYEAVERTWLREAGPEMLYPLHQVRGLLSALVAAGLGELRSAPPLLSEGPGRAQARCRRVG